MWLKVLDSHGHSTAAPLYRAGTQAVVEVKFVVILEECMDVWERLQVFVLEALETRVVCEGPNLGVYLTTRSHGSSVQETIPTMLKKPGVRQAS